EGLSCLLKSRSESSNMSGLQVAPSSPKVNHLLFADDSLLFFKANSMGATEVNLVLDRYCQASGQRINYNKSSVYFSKGVPDSIRTEVKTVLQVPNETLNEKYLGMPSDIGSSKSGAFKYLKDRLWSKCKGGLRAQCLQQAKRFW
uniref:Reverse transcriptase domain-containing protein n=1 Tax=Aegilops tauschii subsp. strangulata TaxID=200361 RepID=A0A453LIN7_AEGTS